MKSLLLLRHAEAAAENSKNPDSERPLTKYGESQCYILGDFFKRLAYEPDRIECSSAFRTQQTAKLLKETAQWPGSITPYEDLYSARTEELMAHVSLQDNNIRKLILIAHAPSLGELFAWLISKNRDAASIFSPGTAAEIYLEIESWSEVQSGCGAVRLILPGM